MLKALYDYGVRNGVAIPLGFVRKKITAYISLSSNGDFLGIEQYDDEIQLCPDVGSLNRTMAQPIVDKVSNVLSPDGKKAESFRSLLEDCAKTVPELGLCLSALQTESTFRAICDAVNLRKLKKEQLISFKVDGVPLVSNKAVIPWWTEYRKQFKEPTSQGVYCMISGERTAPLSTLPALKGLSAVGGQGDTPLFCFDKSAFQSYGLKKSANAPVSEEAFSVVKDALNDLIAGSPTMYRREKNRDFNPVAPIFAGMKFLHWYDCQLEPQEDLIHCAFSGFDEDEEDEEEASCSSQEDLTQIRQKEQQERRKAHRLFDEIGSGAQAPILKSNYYILLISGNNGRAMVRRYEHGSYETLRTNLDQWNRDIALSDRLGTGTVRAHKLTYRLQRLVKDRKNTGSKLFEQMKKELAGITPTIVTAILNGTPLPDTVAIRSLDYIRSRLLKPDENAKFPYLPDDVACQWLKAWLIRKSRMKKEAVLSMNYDCAFPNAAYHCGALMAVYADLQRAAMGDLNATLIQRFYASASRTPTLVLGTLERMGEIYLSQLQKEGKYGVAKTYEQRLNEVYSFFESNGSRQLPAALNLEDQSYFALGYRQMCTKIIAEKNAARAAKKEEL